MFRKLSEIKCDKYVLKSMLVLNLAHPVVPTFLKQNVFADYPSTLTIYAQWTFLAQ